MGGVLRGIVVVGAWAVVVVVAVVVAALLVGRTPTVAHAGLQAVLPQLGLAASVALLVAVATRSRALAMGAGLAVVACLAPALSLAWSQGDGQLVDAARPAELTVYAHNLRYDNATPEAAARQALDSGAEVLVVVELTPATVALLAHLGADERYPHQLLDPAAHPYGAGIYSRLPLGEASVEVGDGLRLPSATVALAGGEELRLVAVHVAAPVDAGMLASWERELAALAGRVERSSGPVAYVGDFNATRWHPAFGGLLDAGLVDAHEAAGAGFSRSWPFGRGWGRLGPQARLDHALVRGVGIVGVRDLPAAGSDHAAFEVGLTPAA